MNYIAVVDLGTGNLHSVAKAIEHVAPDARVAVSADARVIAEADRLVLPGQGAIGTWFNALGDRNLKLALDRALNSKPVLGICLGLQALFGFSEEDGGIDGLGFLSGRVKRFEFGAEPSDSLDPSGTETRLKVPHMGWNNVDQTHDHPLWQGVEQRTRFYFVHSYYALSEDRAEVAGVTEYGIRFTSAAMKANIFGVQFHPEKSHDQGLKLLKNFAEWDGSR